uniref:Uncharacterized protein n=1 Tax=Schistocephalus solidus TaxID=70667 RepID=A0A0X3P5A5_SCHSO
MCRAETDNIQGSADVFVHRSLKLHLTSAPKIPHARRLDVTKIRQPSTAEVLSTEDRSRYATRANGKCSSNASSLKNSGFTHRRRNKSVDEPYSCLPGRIQLGLATIIPFANSSR